MLYAADIWYTPSHHSDPERIALGSVGTVNKLTKVQRIAALHITGTLRSTATDVLEAHADLIPIRLALDKHSYSATLRLLTLPPNHPLHTHIRKAS